MGCEVGFLMLLGILSIELVIVKLMSMWGIMVFDSFLCIKVIGM